MSDSFQCFENHLDEINAILRRNQVNARRSMQLIGLYLNLYEGRMRMRWQSQNEEYAHLKAILASILDAITHILGEVGASIPETDFQKLMAHSSALHDWGSQ